MQLIELKISFLYFIHHFTCKFVRPLVQEISARNILFPSVRASYTFSVYLPLHANRLDFDKGPVWD